MNGILDYILSTSPEVTPLHGVVPWWLRHSELNGSFAKPIERAIAGGFCVDRPGYAFASGYQEALVQLFGPCRHKRALCVTEEAGNHPQAIQTRLERDASGVWVLEGHKRWVTLGTHADELLVAATTGQDDQGRNRVVVVAIPPDGDGVTLESMGPSSFVPEIPHTGVRLDRVRVEDDRCLSGDGYARYIKPFRTVEDVHVYAALLAWLVQVGRRCDWPNDLVEQFVALIASLYGLAAADPLSGGVHVALAGVIGQARHLLAEDVTPHWLSVDDDTRARWHRDHALLDVVGRAQARRRETAWAQFAGPANATET